MVHDVATSGSDSEAGWPALSTESRPWDTDRERVALASRRQLALARGDYQAAVPPMIANAAVRLTAETLAAADDASQELARFDSEAGRIAAPFASILLRSESASSSEVENLTSSAKQVALAELDASSSGNAKLVVANVRAMTAALELADGIDEEAIIAMQHALLGESAPHFTGKFRDQQEWIGGATDDAVFERVRRRVCNLTHTSHDVAEYTQIVHYQQGQHYWPHTDYLERDTVPTNPYYKAGGNRLLTVLYYLSDVENGGHTIFPYVNSTLSPETNPWHQIQRESCAGQEKSCRYWLATM